MIEKQCGNKQSAIIKYLRYELYFLIQLFILLGTLNNIQAQSDFTVSGYVKDAGTGEVLIGATVYNAKSKSGSRTNNTDSIH